jgi:lipopolysaccharide/colanic/teichoic acid biosynthesis glycosyltransferase
MNTQEARLSHPAQIHIKNIMDVFLSLVCLVFSAIPFLLIMICIKLDSKGPVFFKQERPGKDGKIFTLYKFRTMAGSHDKNGNSIPDEKRITPVGKFLRKFSLDELPELWNVVRGDMSFVGPRPLLVSYLERYSPEQARRHGVKPGITGWAQVKGRNVITWVDKFKYDIWYVDNWNLALDLKILLITAVKVLRKEGISKDGYVSMEEFMGTSSKGMEE